MHVKGRSLNHESSMESLFVDRLQKITLVSYVTPDFHILLTSPHWSIFGGLEFIHQREDSAASSEGEY